MSAAPKDGRTANVRRRKRRSERFFFGYFLKELEINSRADMRRINWSGQGEGRRRSSAASTDDNADRSDLDKQSRRVFIGNSAVHTKESDT